eukprot:Clim_evm10s158 gene=Clim_evmTU10s158
MPNRLITFKISHYCERGRWLLDRYQISYEEEPHLPIWHAFVNKPYGGRATPVLIWEDTDKRPLLCGDDICEYTKVVASPETFPKDSLFFTDHTKNEEVARWLEVADKFGIHMRRVVYGFIIEQPKLWECFKRGTPWYESSTLWLVNGFLISFIRKGLNVNAGKCMESLMRCQEIMDEVEKHLSDGRKYLVGNRFSAADLTLAALSSLVVYPDDYAKHFTPYQPHDMDEGYGNLVEQTRSRPYGQYVLRIYRDHRTEKIKV